MAPMSVAKQMLSWGNPDVGAEHMEVSTVRPQREREQTTNWVIFGFQGHYPKTN